MGCGQTDQKLEGRRIKNEEDSKQIISDFITKYRHNIKLNEKEFHQKFIETILEFAKDAGKLFPNRYKRSQTQ